MAFAIYCYTLNSLRLKLAGSNKHLLIRQNVMFVNVVHQFLMFEEYLFIKFIASSSF